MARARLRSREQPGHHSHVVDEIIFAVDSQILAELEGVFLLCDEEGVRTCVAVDFFPTRQQHGGARAPRDDALLTFSAVLSDEFRLLVKRAFDVAISTRPSWRSLRR